MFYRLLQPHRQILRSFTTLNSSILGVSPNVQKLLDVYENIKTSTESFVKKDPRSCREVFANNQLRMEQVDVIGFDYDYTMCHYTEELQHLIYSEARDHLVEKLRYPSKIQDNCQYDPTFAIRGLTIDIEKGLLCKMSSHQKLASHGVFRGRQRLTRDKILEEYNGTRHISQQYRDECMKPLNDLFSVSHACLFADIVQYFIDNGISYEPVSVFEDIDAAIGHVHESGAMHKAVVKDLPRYLEPIKQLRELIQGMKDDGKQLFLCTNSSFRYIDAGLRYSMGEDWMDLFDVVMVSARKPEFYVRNRAFRVCDVEKRRVKWQPVQALRKGSVYTQGSLSQLVKIKGWHGRRVLYIGDSLFSDLVEPSRIQGWRTGAIIRELEEEILIQGTDEYQQLEYQVQGLEVLLRRVQQEISSRSQSKSPSYLQDTTLLAALVEEHEQLQLKMGKMVNQNFGSVFRVENHSSQFAFCVQRYVDVYTSRLENFMDYPDNYTFFPQSQRLPHQPLNQYQKISDYFDAGSATSASK